MINIVEANLNLRSTVKKLRDFLKDGDLELENLDALFVALEGDQWVGVGGKEENVLKNIMVLEAYQDTGISGAIVDKLVKLIRKEKFPHAFVYTKKENSLIFKGLGFKEIARAKETSLLLKNYGGIDKILEEMEIELPNGHVGSVVLNANPFTLGHKFLIDQALQYVDHLIVFLVENDKSFFSFNQRFRMAKNALKNYENISLVKSGPLIISQATFPSYFLKEDRLINEEHARLDGKIFSDFIGPYFGIKYRFLGSEDMDPSTEIYNNILIETLEPEISVKIIPRLIKDGEVISASKVRYLLKEGNLIELFKYIPEDNIRILEEIYESLGT